ncbi:MAG: hypothetical protein Q4B14_02515 [Clostridia bacterium]|nr:hypothetical protein [Clostridia bacterium]
MFEALFLSVLIVLICIGLADLFCGVISLVLSGRNKKNKNLIMVSVNENPEQTEFLLRSIAYRFKLGNWGKDSKIICVYDGENQEIKKICQSLCKEYAFMELKNSKQLGGIINNL